jgi:glutamate/tyrosine decarboxylase-like PLP-dependent enzyme
LDLDFFFPPGYGDSALPELCEAGLESLHELMPDGDVPRIPGEGLQRHEDLQDFYGRLPAGPTNQPGDLLRRMSRDLLAGAVNWRCPELQYNLGAPVNVVAAAMYAVALDVNVYLINDGLAGSAVAAETAVVRILGGLAGLPRGQAHGAFVFGGTGTMAYAIKSGIRKAAPDSSRAGVPDDVKLMITEDAHFSHATAADWLGIGSDNLLVARAAADRRSLLDDAERQLRQALEEGCRVAAVIINGGTTYDHAVDDIPGFFRLRDRLVEDYELPYRPHLHVDSVVGWAWLMFRDYDYDRNPVGIAPYALDTIRKQYDRIRHVMMADSWGIDFHKGVGACPIDSSVVVFNKRADLVRLRKDGSSSASMHQLAREFSAQSPVDYTLETSRSGGKALSALASLHSLGQAGYQELLGRLVESTAVFRQHVAVAPQIDVLNPYALGYQTMVRLCPPSGVADPRRGHELSVDSLAMSEFIERGNNYLREFFAWDDATRMVLNGGGVVYSFSRKYVTAACGVPISGLKFYPTSPRIRPRHMMEAVQLLLKRKAEFDRERHA